MQVFAQEKKLRRKETPIHFSESKHNPQHAISVISFKIAFSDSRAICESCFHAEPFEPVNKNAFQLFSFFTWSLKRLVLSHKGEDTVLQNKTVSTTTQCPSE